MPRRYGWKPDVPDFRDHTYRATKPVLDLPRRVDLRPQCGPVEDQGTIGSCTGHAISSAMEFAVYKGEHKREQFSRLFIYWQEREIEGTVDADDGAEIRNGVKVCAKMGAPLERYWPYNVARFRDEPGKIPRANALKHRITSYMRVNGLAQVKSSLATGFPVIFGFSVYTSFESAAVARSGHVPMPRASEKLLGGHAVLAVGYDDDVHALIVRNSWGKDWGLEGYFTLPYGYVESRGLSDDYWTIRQ